VAGMPGATMSMAGESWSRGASFNADVEPDSVRTIKLYVTLPKDRLPDGTHDFIFHVEYRQTGETYDYRASFVAPGK